MRTRHALATRIVTTYGAIAHALALIAVAIQ